MYQKIVLVGNLGKDPVMRYAPDGTPVTTFSMATNRKWSDGNGETQEEVVWWRVTTWRRRAEVCNEYLKKGSKVLVEGRVRPDKETGGPRVYERDDGSHGAQYEIVASNVKFLSSPRNGNNGSAPAQPEDVPPMGPEDEIPF